MPNHVHLILVPDREQALGRALGETHRRYSTAINARLRVTGHLFQARFGSAAMDEEHLITAARRVLTGFQPRSGREQEYEQRCRCQSAPSRAAFTVPH
jgi:hypothetical protein